MSESGSTPNVVVQNPTVRRVAGWIIGTAAVRVPTLIVVDVNAPAFDLSAWTTPAMAATSFLAGVFQLAVSTPNVPRA